MRQEQRARAEAPTRLRNGEVTISIPNSDLESLSTKPRALAKIIIDALMSISLMALMGRQFWGDVAHESIGAGMFVLFIVHHILNLHWYRAMFKGTHTLYRSVRLVIDGCVFVAMIALMVSGIILSQHVFVFLSISGGTAFARVLHLLATYWGFVLMALHLGLHWRELIGALRRATGTTQASPIQARLLGILGIGIAGYGLYVFIDRNLLRYMFLRTLFAFLDYDESRVLFYLDYLAMMGFFVWVAHTVGRLLRERSVTKGKEKRTRSTIDLRRRRLDD